MQQNFDLSNIKILTEKDYKQIKAKIAKKLLQTDSAYIGTSNFNKFYYNLDGTYGYTK